MLAVAAHEQRIRLGDVVRTVLATVLSAPRRLRARDRAALSGRDYARIERADVADPAFRPPDMAGCVHTNHVGR